MSAYSAAIAWEFRQRHRWGLVALAGYFGALAVIKYAIVAPGLPIRFDSNESFAFTVVVPLTVTFTYFLAVFSFGYAGDLAARESMYPSRLFALPVTSAALTGWPMLYGAVAMASLWAATRVCALFPSSVAIPYLWPGFLAASLMAWTQALTWMPYPLRGLRVIVTVLWIATIDAIVLLALYQKPREWVMLAIIAPQLPLAYLTARIAIARARRGDVPDWRGRILSTASRTTTFARKGAFASAARAQAWFEWRRDGHTLPVWVAILLPFELSLLLLAGNAPTLVVEIILGVLLTPPIIAAFAAAAVSTAPTSYDTTRPLADVQLVGAKLTMLLRSTLAAWLLVLIAIPVALQLSGRLPDALAQLHGMRDSIGAPRTVVVLLLLLVGLVISTWKQLVRGLYIGLTGRDWLVKGSMFVILILVVLLGPFLDWVVTHAAVRGIIWNAIPLALAVLVCVKLCLAAAVVTMLHRRHIVSDRTLVTSAACWCAAVLALRALLLWILSTPFIPAYGLTLVAILFIPLTRLSAAPLALAWHRHR